MKIFTATCLCLSGPWSIRGAVQPTLGKRRACLLYFAERVIPKVSPSFTCSAFTLELAQGVETLMRRTIEAIWFQWLRARKKPTSSAWSSPGFRCQW